jgi:hypothetical protein
MPTTLNDPASPGSFSRAQAVVEFVRVSSARMCNVKINSRRAVGDDDDDDLNTTLRMGTT